MDTHSFPTHKGCLLSPHALLPISPTGTSFSSPWRTPTCARTCCWTPWSSAVGGRSLSAPSWSSWPRGPASIVVHPTGSQHARGSLVNRASGFCEASWWRCGRRRRRRGRGGWTPRYSSSYRPAGSWVHNYTGWRLTWHREKRQMQRLDHQEPGHWWRGGRVGGSEDK